MAAEIWSVVVDGVAHTWPQVVFKISTGAWTLSQAVRATGFSAQALQMRLAATAADAGLNAALRNAAATAARSVAAEAATGVAGGGAAGGAAAGGAAATGGGAISGFFGTIGGWLGLTGGAAVAAGVIVTTAVLGGITYVGAQYAGERAGDPPTARLGPVANRTECPPPRLHRTMCPWDPQSPEYFVGECGPGFCWDGGGRGSGVCQPLKVPPNGKRTYTNGVECLPGFTEQVDPCTHVILACKGG